MGLGFDDHQTPEITSKDRVQCVFVLSNDQDIDSDWAEALGGKLSHGTILGKFADGTVFTELDISTLVQNLRRVLVIGYKSQEQNDDPERQQLRCLVSIPLRLAYFMTVRKVQGTSLDKIKFTPGGKKASGTTFTALTRSRRGFQDILFACEEEFDVTDFRTKANAKRKPHEDMIRIDELISNKAFITQYRQANSLLFANPPAFPPNSEELQINIGHPVYAEFVETEEVQVSAAVVLCGTVARNARERGRGG